MRQKELEKSLKAAGQREAAGRAAGLLEKSETLGSLPAIVADLGEADGDALQAAAQPAPGTALYFVALGDGSGAHEFSATLGEHNAAVARYLQRLRENRSRAVQQ